MVIDRTRATSTRAWPEYENVDDDGGTDGKNNGHPQLHVWVHLSIWILSYRTSVSLSIDKYDDLG